MASQFELTREYLYELKEIIRTGNESKAKELIQDLHAADIAELYDELNIKEARFLYLLLEGEIASDVLAELEEDDRERFLEMIPGEVIARQFIDNMDTDDAADIIGELSEEKKEDVLQHLDDVELAGDIVDLLSYDEDSAGGLMGKELSIFPRSVQYLRTICPLLFILSRISSSQRNGSGSPCLSSQT